MTEACTSKEVSQEISVPQVKSFVFFDLETTGLYNEPRILELALCAISREAILETPLQLGGEYNIKYGNNKTWKVHGKAKVPMLPRVLHKLVQLYYPWRVIRRDVERITGLSNDILHELQSFNLSNSQIILKFLQNLPQPICLVAHNGNKFDFPILKAELQNVDGWENFKDFLCIDSLIFLRDIDSKVDAEENISDTCLSQDMFVLTPEEKLQSNGLPVEFKTPTKKTHVSELPETPVKRRPSADQITPQKNKGIQKNLAKRRLFKSKLSYKQEDVFQRLFVDSYAAHCAEGDALALMKICLKYKENFVQWADKNVNRLSNIEPKWNRVKKCSRIRSVKTEIV